VLEPVRSSILLGTKFKWSESATPEQLDEILGASLERLKTPYVDLLQCHGLNITDELAHRMLSSFLPDWLSRAKAKGLARQVGFTAETPSAGVERLLRSGVFATMQIGYNVMATGACDYRWGPFGVIPLARELGIGVLSMRTSTSGLLQRLFSSEFPDLDQRKLTRLAIRYALSTPELDCALVGMQSVADVCDAVALLEDGAPRYDLDALNRRR
jgi:predicted aldo/keto reductase-like oxidoreductase